MASLTCFLKSRKVAQVKLDLLKGCAPMRITRFGISRHSHDNEQGWITCQQMGTILHGYLAAMFQHTVVINPILLNKRFITK